MIINRRTFNIKPGHVEEAVQSIFEVMKVMGNSDRAVRTKLLTAAIGPFDVLVMETEHPDLGQYQKDWEETFAHPAMEPFMKKWFEMNAGGGTNEIWEVLTPKE